jgi:hypothetical protein
LGTFLQQLTASDLNGPLEVLQLHRKFVLPVCPVTLNFLIAVADLTFVKAIEIAVAVETANKDAIELRGKSNPESSVNKVQRHHRPTSSVKTGKQKSNTFYNPAQKLLIRLNRYPAPF